MSGKISPVLFIPWARKSFGALQGSASLQGCEHPQWSGPAQPIQELQPALPSAAAQTTGKGQGLKGPARPAKFLYGSSPWGSALCHQPLYLHRDKRKRLLSGQTAALPKHCCHPTAKPLRSWVAARSALTFTVIINQAGVTFPATSCGQHWHGSKPWWVRSAQWVPEGLHPCAWIDWKMPSQHGEQFALQPTIDMNFHSRENTF